MQETETWTLGLHWKWHTHPFYLQSFLQNVAIFTQKIRGRMENGLYPYHDKAKNFDENLGQVMWGWLRERDAGAERSSGQFYPAGIKALCWKFWISILIPFAYSFFKMKKTQLETDKQNKLFSLSHPKLYELLRLRLGLLQREFGGRIQGILNENIIQLLLSLSFDCPFFCPLKLLPYINMAKR